MIQLRKYQEKNVYEGLKILQQHKILYLAMQTRTGKTLTSLSIANKYEANNVLFVTKKKVINSVQQDYDKLNPNYEITIINYESLHKINGKFDLIIIDESHSLGAFPKPSKRTHRLKKICGNLPIIYLSATPTPESYSQIFHQFWVSNNSPFANYGNNKTAFYKWAKDFVEVKKKYLYNYQINDYSDADSQKIKKITDKYFITLSQEEAGFAQKIEEKIHFVKINSNIYKLLDILIKNRYYKSKDSWEIVLDTPASIKNKHHQICSGTVLDNKGNYHILDNSKANYIKDNFNGKICIFYKFRGEAEILKNIFSNYTEIPEEFEQFNDKIFIGQFQSAREGINLKSAEHLIFYNIDFSFLSYEQTKNRFQDLYRNKKAYIHWIFSKNGIEEKIYKVLQKKKDYTLYYYKKDYLSCKKKQNYKQKSLGI